MTESVVGSPKTTTSMECHTLVEDCVVEAEPLSSESDGLRLQSGIELGMREESDAHIISSGGRLGPALFHRSVFTTFRHDQFPWSIYLNHRRKVIDNCGLRKPSRCAARIRVSMPQARSFNLNVHAGRRKDSGPD